MIVLEANQSITVKSGDTKLVIQAYPNGEIEVLPQDIMDINKEILSDSSGYVTFSPHQDKED
jgi:hypothetical protein